MRRINLKRAMALVILTVMLTTLHVIVQATISRERDGSAVRARFDLATPTGGPFPSNRFTVRDRSHNTGLSHCQTVARPPSDSRTLM